MPEPEPNQEPKKRTQERKPSGDGNGQSGPSPTQPWVWLLIVGVAAALIWSFRPGNETKVDYAWFLEQVKRNNIEKFANQSTKIYGQLRVKTPYALDGKAADVDKFYVDRKSVV